MDFDDLKSEDTKRTNRNNAEKKRRDQFNTLLTELGNILNVMPEASSATAVAAQFHFILLGCNRRRFSRSESMAPLRSEEESVALGVLLGSDGIQYSWVHGVNVHFREGQSLVASTSSPFGWKDRGDHPKILNASPARQHLRLHRFAL